MLRNRIYYSVKPFIPQPLRSAVRRHIALRLQERVGDVWPIMPGSERAPDRWSGWPDGKKFAVVLTHDVEGPLGLRRCRRLAELESELGFRSSFNFIPAGPYHVPPELREELTAQGFEVGVHDLHHDGRLYRTRRGFLKRAQRINEFLAEWNAQGFRSGFMLHNLDWLHQLDIRYDMSTFDTDPFEPQPEGRHTIFPFFVSRPSDRGGDGPDDGYVELPYTLPQDSTLFLLLRHENFDVWIRKLDWIAAHGGMALLDTHPDYMAFGESTQSSTEYPVNRYLDFLRYIQARYKDTCWLALPGEVATHVSRMERGMVSRTALLPPKLQPQLGLPIRPQAAAEVHPRMEEPPQFFANGSSPKTSQRLKGKRAAVLLFSNYPADPRPRRAAEALSREGVTVDLLCLQQNQRELRSETINGVNVRRVPFKRYRGGKFAYIGQYSAFILISFAYLTVRSLRKRYDLIHVHNMPDVLVFAAAVPKALGAKIILDLHDPMPELMQTIFKLPRQSFSVRLLQTMEKKSLAFAHLVLTVNRACKDLYSARSCRPEKIHVVLNSPDDHLFLFRAAGGNSRNGHGAEKPFVILYHGSIVRRNGLDLAVEAVEIAGRAIPNLKLLVCGERTPFFDEVLETVKRRGLSDSFQYLGRRNLPEIVEAIDSCDLGIIPNHRNIFTEINTPTRIFEYLALGKPVIAPRAKGIQDYFADQDLIFFELGNATDLARKIEYAFAHQQEVDAITKRGQQVYLDHTWTRERSKFLQAVSELV